MLTCDPAPHGLLPAVSVGHSETSCMNLMMAAEGLLNAVLLNAGRGLPK